MYDQPTARELIDAVQGFLRDEVSPTLSGRLAFHARVAVNVLETVKRELELGPGAVAGEGARLAALLGREFQAGERSVEKAAIGRRASEVEVDLLAMLVAPGGQPLV